MRKKDIIGNPSYKNNDLKKGIPENVPWHKPINSMNVSNLKLKKVFITADW